MSLGETRREKEKRVPTEHGGLGQAPSQAPSPDLRRRQTLNLFTGKAGKAVPTEGTVPPCPPTASADKTRTHEEGPRAEVEARPCHPASGDLTPDTGTCSGLGRVRPPAQGQAGCGVAACCSFLGVASPRARRTRSTRRWFAPSLSAAVMLRPRNPQPAMPPRPPGCHRRHCPPCPGPAPGQSAFCPQLPPRPSWVTWSSARSGMEGTWCFSWDSPSLARGRRPSLPWPAAPAFPTPPAAGGPVPDPVSLFQEDPPIFLVVPASA